MGAKEKSSLLEILLKDSHIVQCLAHHTAFILFPHVPSSPPPPPLLKFRNEGKTLPLIWSKWVWRLQYIGKTKRVAENISLQWKNVFLSCGIFLICGRSFHHWKNIFLSSGWKYFVALEGKISRGREYFCCMEENISVLWKTLFLFCVSKYLCPEGKT